MKDMDEWVIVCFLALNNPTEEGFFFFFCLLSSSALGFPFFSSISMDSFLVVFQTGSDLKRKNLTLLWTRLGISTQRTENSAWSQSTCITALSLHKCMCRLLYCMQIAFIFATFSSKTSLSFHVSTQEVISLSWFIWTCYHTIHCHHFYRRVKKKCNHLFWEHPFSWQRNR